MADVQFLIMQIAVILAVSRILGLIMRAVHQPQVVGEMVAGLILGPSVLGLIHHGQWLKALFPAESIGSLNLLSQLGVIFFMFLVGLELDPKLLRGQGKAALVTGTVGIVIPFASGAILALCMALFVSPAVIGAIPNKLVLMLFIGAAMSITAFPVLARILTERNLHKTRTGVLALTCAAMDDVMGWCILAFVLAVAHMEGFTGAAPAGHGAALVKVLMTAGLAAGYVAVMIFAVRPLLAQLQSRFESRGYLSQNVLAVVFLLLLASSFATDKIGIHAIFGAFMLGAVMPTEGRFVKHLSEKIEDFTVLLLLPIFFAYTGLRTSLGLLDSPSLWALCAGVVAVAVAGKFFGVTLASRWYGMNWRQSSLLGVLMNTRGLMELIILNIGLDLKVLSPSVFAMMVIMALVTTFMTTPLMRLLYSPARQKKELEEAAANDAEQADGLNVAVPVSLITSAPSLIRIGALLMAGDPGRIYALHLDRPDEPERRARGVLPQADQVLDVAQREARQMHVPINAVSFISRHFARDICDAAARYRASWVVIGWHKPFLFQSALGGTVGQVLGSAKSNVGIFIDKGLADVKRVVVPYLGDSQDSGALLAAERFAKSKHIHVTILHVVKPDRKEGDVRLGLQTLVDKQMPAIGTENQIRMQIVESNSPIDVVVQESHRYDLMILGISDEWKLRGGLLNKQESVVQLAACSLLIVHANPAAPKAPGARPRQIKEEEGEDVAKAVGPPAAAPQ